MSRALLLVLLGATAALGAPQEQPVPTEVETEPQSDAEPSGLRSAGEVRETLEAIFESPEYRRLARPKRNEKAQKKPSPLPAWLERFLDWLLGDRPEREGSASFSMPGALVGLLRLMLYAVVGAAFAWVVFLILKSVLRGSPGTARAAGRPTGPGEEVSPSTPPGELPSEEYLQRALALARAGKHKEAIRQLLLGAMSWMERQGLVRYRKGLTNRDYLRAIWHRPGQREPLAAIILAFDQIYFGRRPATAERFAECLKSYRAGFSTT
jgi:hypothetical protein